MLGQKVGDGDIKDTWTEVTEKIQRRLNLCRTRNLTWIGKILLLHTMAASRLLHHARTVTATANVIRDIQRIFFQFLWVPEKIESISRNILIGERNLGGLQAPHVESKLWTCQMEKVMILHRLERPTQFWQQHLLYFFGTKIKKINQKLYHNSMPHSNGSSPYVTKLLHLHQKIDWDFDTSNESSHRKLYKRLKSFFERQQIIHSSDGKEIPWARITGTETWQQNVMKSQERVMSYIVAHNGYIFGTRRSETRLKVVNSNRCVICNNTNYDR